MLACFLAMVPKVKTSRCVPVKFSADRDEDTRRLTRDSAQWFKANNGFLGHVSNAYENENGHIGIDIVMGEQNVSFFWPDVNAKMGTPEGILTNFRRFTIDFHSASLVLPPPKNLGDHDVEFPRMDERYMRQKHSHSYMDLMVKSETDWWSSRIRWAPVSGCTTTSRTLTM